MMSGYNLFVVTDVDECTAPAPNAHQCTQNCLNAPGTYSCTCNSGYKLSDWKTCVGMFRANPHTTITKTV